jgi:hemoglobin-like flavoprotein
VSKSGAQSIHGRFVIVCLEHTHTLLAGLINMLTYVLGEASMTETVLQTWNKIYRVMEQSIIANIIKL